MAMTYTPADDILREVRDLHQFILDLLASPATVRWHWPTYYLLYVDIDRMAWRIQATQRLFVDEIDLTPSTCVAEDRQTRAEQAQWANDTFAELGKTLRVIVERLWQVSRNMMTVVEDPRLRQRVRAHFHPKSEWYQVFQSDYCPGRVVADGRTLERTILTIDPDPPERIHDLGAKNLYVSQQFDIGTDAARSALAQALARVADEHAAVDRAMADFFLAHCSVEKLLYPSSV